jgi:hypothetical protein
VYRIFAAANVAAVSKLPAKTSTAPHRVALFVTCLVALVRPSIGFAAVKLLEATCTNLAAWKQWAVGAQFGFAGFTVGGTIGYDNNGAGANYFAGVDKDTRFYTGHHARDRLLCHIAGG